MKIGIDFDNTIVCYDGVFARVGEQLAMVPPGAAHSKVEVRTHLVQSGREDAWTRLQGEVYGPMLRQATLYPGVEDFFLACAAASVTVAIISHRTRTPIIGPPHDLHASARNWLEERGFFSRLGLARDAVHFETTLEGKVNRIRLEGCSFFVDDLPDVLVDASFPASTQPIIFDPDGLHTALGRPTVASFYDLRKRTLGS